MKKDVGFSNLWKNLSTLIVQASKQLTKSQSNSTNELVEGCRRNDRQSQQQLYELYCDAMFNTAVRMLGNAAEAEDVLQEAFLAAFRGIEMFEGKSTFGAWLKRIVINKCVDHLKKNRLQLVEMETYDTATEVSDDWDEKEGKVSVQEIHQELKGLPDKCRAVFNLYMLEGYDHEEIGEIMNISKSTSKSQLHRARQLLRDRLKV